MCLLTVCFVCLSCLASDPDIVASDAYTGVAGTLLLVLDVAFIGWCVYHLVSNGFQGPSSGRLHLVKQHPWWLTLEGQLVQIIKVCLLWLRERACHYLV